LEFPVDSTISLTACLALSGFRQTSTISESGVAASCRAMALPMAPVAPVTRKTLASAFRLFEEGEGKAIISKPQRIYLEFTVAFETRYRNAGTATRKNADAIHCPLDVYSRN
jgi:hypothetical protein